MPMRSWVSAAVAALALAGCAAARPLSDSAASGERGALRVDLAGRPATVKVALVRSDVDPANDHAVTMLGQRESYVLLTDSYASRAQPLARCQAGHETWVRLIDTRTRTERWSQRVQSCLHDIEPGDPIAAWAPTGTDFTVTMLAAPSLRMTIRPDGAVAAR